MNMVTGTLPAIIYDRLEENGKYTDDIISGGTDIDITVHTGSGETRLYAVTLGNGQWEIIELDDSGNVFPSYDEADILSADALTRALIGSSAIMSFNALGRLRKKARYGNAGKGRHRNTNRNITVEEAEEFIAGVWDGTEVEVQALAEMTDEERGTWKCLALSDEDGSYSVWQLYRNGDDFRNLTADIGLDEGTAVQKYNSLSGEKIEEPEAEYEIYDEEEQPEDDSTDEDETYEEISRLYDKYGGNRHYYSDRIRDLGNRYGDQFLRVASVSRRKRKKNKYNGCNVTGCEDGNLAGQTVPAGGLA